MCYANSNLYVTNVGGGSISIICGQINTVVGNPISLGQEPLGIAFDLANGNLYVANSFDGTVSVLSVQSNTVSGSSVAVAHNPLGIVFDTANGNLYVTNSGDNSVLVITTSTANQPPNTAITYADDGNGAIQNGGTTVSTAIQKSFT